VQRWIEVFDTGFAGLGGETPERRFLGNPQIQRLLADSELLNNGLVAFGIRLSEVIKQAATPAHHHKKPAPGGVILLVRLEVLRQLANAGAQDGNLNFRGTGIVIGSAVVGNQGGFFLSG
jgi:hypothetical protein